LPPHGLLSACVANSKYSAVKPRPVCWARLRGSEQSFNSAGRKAYAHRLPIPPSQHVRSRATWPTELSSWLANLTASSLNSRLNRRRPFAGVRHLAGLIASFLGVREIGGGPTRYNLESSLTRNSEIPHTTILILLTALFRSRSGSSQNFPTSLKECSPSFSSLKGGKNISRLRGESSRPFVPRLSFLGDRRP
jgi:hypothetical protein